MPRRFLVYEWRCPFCSQSRTSLTSADRATIEGQAENALRNHVKQAAGDGHAGRGVLPTEFDHVAGDAIDYVEVVSGDMVGNATR